MNCILGKSFSLGGNFIVMVGLRLSGLNFIPAVALVQTDRIILGEKEWMALQNIKTSLGQFYLDGTSPKEPLKLKRNVVLFNYEGKEIVIKNEKTWHTIRINSHQFMNLMNISTLVNKYLEEELKRKKAFLSFEVSSQIMSVANSLSLLPSEALVLDEDIKAELAKIMDAEVFIVYSSNLVKFVKDAIVVNQQLNYDCS